MKRTSQKAPASFSPELFLSVTGEYAALYENIWFSGDLFVNAAFVSRVGVFLVMADPKTKEPDLAGVAERLGISAGELYTFLYDEEGCVLWNAGERIEVEEIYTAFENLFTNLSRPWIDRQYLSFQGLEDLIHPAKIPAAYEDSSFTDSFVVDGIAYVAEDPFRFVDTGENRAAADRIDSDTVERIQRILLSMENHNFPDPEKKIRRIGDQEYIKKQTAKRIGGISTAFIGREEWFPLSPENTAGVMIKTAFFGWAGWHRFHFGELFGGIFYLITGGCLGILPAMDILSMTFGNASYTVTFYEEGKELSQRKERVFLKAPPQKIYGLFAMGLALLTGYLVFRFGYLSLFKLLGNVLPLSVSSHPELFSGGFDTTFS